MHSASNSHQLPSKKSASNKIKPTELSELFIHLPKLGLGKKNNNNSSDYQLGLQSNQGSKAYPLEYSEATKTDGNSSCSSFTGGKNSLSLFGITKGEKEIVLEWARNKMAKLNLLGPHWESKFRRKRQQFIVQSFGCLKEDLFSRDKYLLLESKQSFLREQVKSVNGFGLQRMIEFLDFVVLKQVKGVFNEIKRKRFKYSRNRIVFINNASSQQIKIYPQKESPRNYYSPENITMPANPNIRTLMNQEEHYKFKMHFQRKIPSAQHIPMISNEYLMSPLAKRVHPAHTQKKSCFADRMPYSRPERTNQVYFSRNSVRPPSNHSRPISQPHFVINQLPNIPNQVINPINIHTLNPKKRPVSASPCLRISCFVKEQNNHLQAPYYQINKRNMKMSMQESPRAQYSRNVGSPQPHPVYIQCKQPAFIVPVSEYQNEHQKYLARQTMVSSKRISNNPQSEYKLHRIGPQSPRNQCPPHFFP